MQTRGKDMESRQSGPVDGEILLPRHGEEKKIVSCPPSSRNEIESLLFIVSQGQGGRKGNGRFGGNHMAPGRSQGRKKERVVKTSGQEYRYDVIEGAS